MSKHLFVKQIVIEDGSFIYNASNKTVLVELVDEEGNVSQEFGSAACFNLDLNSANMPTPDTQPNSAANSSNIHKDILQEIPQEIPKEIPKKIHLTTDDCEELSDGSEHDVANSPPTTSTRPSNWSTGQTKRLLSLYNEYLPEVGPMKKFRTKKNMFEKIAKIINEEFHINFDWNQCSNRLKVVLRQHRNDVKANRTSGATRRHLEFEEKIEAIKAADDSIEPEVRMGVGEMEQMKKKVKTEEMQNEEAKEKLAAATANITQASTSLGGRKPRSVQDTLLFINERKERKRDERHREKLELLHAILKPKTDNQLLIK